MAALSTNAPITPSADDARLAKRSSRRLAPYLDQKLEVRIAETGEQIELPAAAARLLVELLSAMAEGNAVSLVSIHAELTSQQAADLLGVSRPFLIKKLDEGRIPFRRVGTHRRILFSDLMKFKDDIDKQRTEILNELTQQAQDSGMGY